MFHNHSHGTASRPRRTRGSRRLGLVLVLVVAVVGLLAQACTRHNNSKRWDPIPGSSPLPTTPAVPCPATGNHADGGPGDAPGRPTQYPPGLSGGPTSTPNGPAVGVSGGTVSPLVRAADLLAGGGELARSNPDPLPAQGTPSSPAPDRAPPCPNPPTVPCSPAPAQPAPTGSASVPSAKSIPSKGAAQGGPMRPSTES